jgi:hypothetical protein
MNMLGGPDPLYIRARAALLDATDALAPFLDAMVLVGAQAVYLRAGDAGLMVAEYTTDADFAFEPAELPDNPLLEEALESHGFALRRSPGAWLSPDGIPVDFMVPEVLAGPGSRAARLGVHGKRVARRARGLEGTLVDRDRMTISALDADDSRTTELWVAGPAALLVAKVTKISERLGGSRVVDKDALDTLRLLRATTTTDLAHRLSELRQHDLSADVTDQAIAQLDPLFGTETAPGVAMIVRAAGEDGSPSTLTASTIVLTGDLVRALKR